VNGHPDQRVRLDTGCATALHWVTATVKAEDCLHKTAIGLTELSIPQTTTTVALGDRVFKDMPTGLHTEAIFPGEVGLLGNGLLSRFSSIIIDAKAGHLILKERSPAH
jgi:hypothetical protein